MDSTESTTEQTMSPHDFSLISTAQAIHSMDRRRRSVTQAVVPSPQAIAPSILRRAPSPQAVASLIFRRAPLEQTLALLLLRLAAFLSPKSLVLSRSCSCG